MGANARLFADMRHDDFIHQIERDFERSENITTRTVKEIPVHYQVAYFLDGAWRTLSDALNLEDASNELRSLYHSKVIYRRKYQLHLIQVK
jgi:hypothetical protein